MTQVRRAPQGRLPPILSFVGPFVDNQPMGAGIILAVPSGGVGAGASITVTHPLGRVPVYVLPLVNGTPGYPGDAYITTATSTSVTIKFELAQTAATSFYFLS